MKTFIVIFIAAFLGIYTYAQNNLLMPKDSLMSLDSIPNWILKNIQFPQEAYKYGVAGIEQLCISASWDGKVFISSQLNTLNPAFEKEIINVVNKAPKCKFAGNQPQDIFKYMLIDFYRYIPTFRQKNVQRITMHTPPRLAKIPSGPFNSRDKFVEWIYTHIHIPSALINYTDTISFQYVVTTKGKVENISVIHCKSDIVKSSLESTLRASPLWKAAVADGNTLIDVVLCDNLIIKTDCDGNLMPFSRCINTVFCNTKTVPNNPNAIILNPEIKPVYKGESTFSKDIMRNIVIDKKININGSFIIEKDGTVSGVEVVQGFNDKMDSLVVHAIAQTKWTAAMQGGNFVRTVFSFGISRGPLKKQSKYLHYDIFGKHFIALQADPMRTSHSFIQRDGSINYYPFNNQGLFDYTTYYQGLIYYYKNTPQKHGNISKEYFDKIYKLYIKD